MKLYQLRGLGESLHNSNNMSVQFLKQGSLKEETKKDESGEFGIGGKGTLGLSEQPRGEKPHQSP